MTDRTRRHEHRQARAEHRTDRRAARIEPTDRAAARADRREALLDAAAAAVRRDGLHVSMDAIAAEAGITKPILYRHFGDRAGLVQALADRFAGELATELAAALTADSSPRASVERVIDTYLRLIESEPQIYRFIQVRPEAQETVTGFERLVGQSVALALGETLRGVGADSGPAEVLGHALVGMVHAAGDWWVEHRTLPREYLVEQLTAVVWNGLEGVLRR